MSKKEISYQSVSGIDGNLYFRDDISRNAIASEATSPTTLAYIVGEVLFYNDNFYRAKTAIAIGDTLTVGTNIEAVDIHDILKTVPVSNGGTGATTAADARTNLGLGSYATKSGAAVVITANDTIPPSDTSVLWVYPAS